MKQNPEVERLFKTSLRLMSAVLFQKITSEVHNISEVLMVFIFFLP